MNGADGEARAPFKIGSRRSRCWLVRADATCTPPPSCCQRVRWHLKIYEIYATCWTPIRHIDPKHWEQPNLPQVKQAGEDTVNVLPFLGLSNTLDSLHADMGIIQPSHILSKLFH